jgi:hypothetical protein
VTPEERRSYYDDVMTDYSDTLHQIALELYSWRCITKEQYNAKLLEAQDRFQSATGCTPDEVAIYLWTNPLRQASSK